MIFFKALLAGFAIAAPLGPINMVCIKQTVRYGLSGFLIVALGAGLSNLLLSGLAASGSVALVHYLHFYQTQMHILGGFLLVVFGVAELTKAPIMHDAPLQKSWPAVFFQVVSIALSNPLTILGYMSLMLELSDSFQQSGLVFSVMLGLTSASILWRVFLGSVVMQLKSRLVVDYMRFLDILCPLCYFYFGVCSLLKAL